MCCFFKQKTAYEMRISDWSSDVCSSDHWRMAFTAAWSAAFSSPRPIRRDAASAAASVTRTVSRARLRSIELEGELEDDLACGIGTSYGWGLEIDNEIGRAHV